MSWFWFGFPINSITTASCGYSFIISFSNRTEKYGIKIPSPIVSKSNPTNNKNKRKGILFLKLSGKILYVLVI